MVKKVADSELKLGADALHDLDVFRHSHIHVPIHQAADKSNAASSGIKTENWIASSGKHCGGGRKNVQCPVSVVDRDAWGRSRDNGLFFVEEVGALPPAQRLSVRLRISIERRPAPSA